MADNSNAREAFLADFARLERELPGAGLSWAAPLRRAAIGEFERAGLPTTQLEEWRFTSVARIAAVPWSAASLTPSLPAASAVAAHSLVPAEAAELVFVDGVLVPALSQLYGIPEGLKIGSLARALDDDSGWVKTEWVEPYLAKIAGCQGQAFTALNTALHRDGALVWLAPGVTFARPIHLLHVSTGADGGRARALHPRHLIVLSAHAEATVVESFVTLGRGLSFTNAVTEIRIDEGGRLRHLRLQDESRESFHVATVAARLERGASLHSGSLALGAALARTEIHVAQAGEGVAVNLDGLYLLDGEQHSDNRTTVDHAWPHGSSSQLYKGILGDQSHGVFNGRILVREQAQKTDSRQTNRNLLLADSALIDTKPELEIFADDVKCSHGATIGQLDENAVFYLRSRGLDAEAARSLLTWAFAGEILHRIPVEALRQRMQARVLSRLPGGATIQEIL